MLVWLAGVRAAAFTFSSSTIIFISSIFILCAFQRISMISWSEPMPVSSSSSSLRLITSSRTPNKRSRLRKPLSIKISLR
ncbi:hypothetical protein STG2_161 [Salmonella phage STG2]|uniref:Uncharacterized protein n=1 Tax=Salmonella phage STG2 TaxID=2480623 RepID=A0A3G2KB21_9CAUD|nr:hypothetical protein HOU44_gp074 [Salmonella phage STG2]AYN56125.1 hypothetical protein STG2_161 [Salmonella phage STG2]